MVISPMRYKEHIWNYNPEKIKILSKKEIIENKIPMADNIIQNFGRTARVITGEGSLFGNDCFSQFDELWHLYREESPGVLSVPEFVVMKAYFSDLTIIGEPTDKLITYSFLFTEVMDSEKVKSPVTVHIVSQGESLWDIANRYNVSVEDLLFLNGNIPNPFGINAGDEVKLC